MANPSYLAVIIFGALFMLAGIGLIISGSIGLYNDDYIYSGSSWALLWAGIGLELIGSTLFAVARRIRWHHYIRSRCEHQRQVMANVEHATPPAGYAYSAQAYAVQGYQGQPLGVPPPAGFAAPAYSTYGLPGYEYAVPPMAQAPPPYEGPK